MAKDGRKRGYSQAFQLMMNAMPNRRAQVPRTMTATALSEASTPLEFEWCDKENEKPFDNIMYGPPLERPFHPQLSFHWPHGFTPMPLPQVKAQPDEAQPLQTLIQLPLKNTQGPQLPVGRDGFRPALALGSSPSGEDSIINLLHTEPGPAIFEDNNMMSDSSWFGLPLSPSELPMQDLSLGSDPVNPLPELPVRPVHPRNRTTVHIGYVSDWYHAFPNTPIQDTDIILVFDKGNDAVKLNLHTLCSASPFFSTLLSFDHPLRPQILTLTLRSDFPYAIHALLSFIATGTYAPLPSMRARFPTTTVLDLHVHAYLAGTKYIVPALAHHALSQYISLARMALAIPYDPALPVDTEHAEDLMALDTEFPPPGHAGNAVVRALLESVAMVWARTGGGDALRRGVVEVVKHYFVAVSRVPLFGELMRKVRGFKEDVEGSLWEDGVEVMTYWVGGGKGGGVRFG